MPGHLSDTVMKGGYKAFDECGELFTDKTRKPLIHSCHINQWKICVVATNVSSLIRTLKPIHASV